MTPAKLLMTVQVHFVAKKETRYHCDTKDGGNPARVNVSWSRLTKVKIGEVLTEINRYMLMAAVVFDTEDSATILEVHKLH